MAKGKKVEPDDKFVPAEPFDLDGEVFPYLNTAGAEVNDPVPLEPPIGHVEGPSLIERIREMVRSEKLAQEAAAAGAETFEEADDLEIGDDYDPWSPYENDFDPPVKEILEEVAKAREAQAAATTSGAVREDPKPKKAQPSPPKPSESEAEENG